MRGEDQTTQRIPAVGSCQAQPDALPPHKVCRRHIPSRVANDWHAIYRSTVLFLPAIGRVHRRATEVDYHCTRFAPSRGGMRKESYVSFPPGPRASHVTSPNGRDNLSHCAL